MSALATAVILLVTLGTLAAGLVGNHFFRKHEPGKTAVEVKDLVAPIGTLSVFLLAFLMAIAFSSYRAALDATATEAGVLSSMAETAALVQVPALRTQLTGDLACYANAVRDQEWPAMAAGNSAPVVTVWNGRIAETLVAIGKDGKDDDVLVGQLLTLDQNRYDARQQRLINAAPTVPTALYVFLLIAAGLALFSLSLFTETSIRRVVQIPILAVFAVLLISMLVLIQDMDRPFAGFVNIKPTLISQQATDLTAQYQQSTPAPLPCDSHGNPAG
jgi:cytochrome bd-type quinol oxidase subunit 2